MSVCTKPQLQDAVSRIIPVLEGYYPQQLTDPEFIKMLYDNFDNKTLAEITVQSIKAYVQNL